MDKKKIILCVIVLILLFIVFFLAYLVFNKYVLKSNFENSVLNFADKNQSTIFEIKKVALFSSCNAKNKNISINNYTLENIYQYTDIALFVSNEAVEKNLENTFKKVSIENIKFNTMPSSRTTSIIF